MGNCLFTLFGCDGKNFLQDVDVLLCDPLLSQKKPAISDYFESSTYSGKLLNFMTDVYSQ